MDDVTAQVRAQYDRFPYPDQRGQLRADTFVELLLSYVSHRSTRGDRPLQILDAGCGTGSGTVAVAAVHPTARVVGVDVSSGALDEARAAARDAGVQNLELVQGDLLDPGQLPTASGGYDVIYASGVLHHLADPAQGARNLAGLLAPRGVMVVMLYGQWARTPAFRMARALDRLAPDRTAYDQRIPLARELLAGARDSAVTAPPWTDAAHLPDNELVDRYLHRCDRGYTVPELFELLQGADLNFVRWLEPRVWDPRYLMDPGPAVDRLATLGLRQRYDVLDLLYDHPDLTVVVSRSGVGPRPPLSTEGLRRSVIEWNPQAAIRSTARLVGGQVNVSDLEVLVRQFHPYALDGIAAAVVQAAAQPARGGAIVEAAMNLTGADEAASFQTLAELLELEILFAP